MNEPRPGAFGPDASISLAIKTIHFCDGSTESLGPTDVVVVVGANSAGKTQFLRDLYAAVHDPPSRARDDMWANEVEIDRQGDENTFRTWFDERARYSPSPRAEPRYAISYRTDGDGMHLEPFDAWHAWTHSSHFHTIARYMLAYLGAAERGQIRLNGRPARNPMESPHDAIHHLWDSLDAEAAFSRLVEQAFGFSVCVNRHERNSIGLLKGRPHADHYSVPPSRAALDWYASLPWLEVEGDGVRAFIGIMLETVAARPLMTFIDEPETFLHPRHAKLIGRYLVEYTVQSGQVFIATHSEDVLQGVLDGGTRAGRNVKVIRLDRVNGTHPTLDPDRVRGLWANPIFRYSRLLSGLFHRGVVICEADNDARFYEAHLDALVTADVDHDLSITHLNGWGRFDQALAELRAHGVPSAVIGDIDVLQDTSKLEKLVEAAQGDFKVIAKQVGVIQKRVSELGGGPRTGAVLDAMEPLQAPRRTRVEPVSQTEREAIKKALRGESGWEQMKTSGRRALRGTEAASAAPEVLDYLKTIGIFLVPEGDLEAWFFLPTRKGAEMVIKVLGDGLHLNPPSELKEFLTSLLKYFQVETA